MREANEHEQAREHMPERPTERGFPVQIHATRIISKQQRRKTAPAPLDRTEVTILDDTVGTRSRRVPGVSPFLLRTISSKAGRPPTWRKLSACRVETLLDAWLGIGRLKPRQRNK